MPDVPTLKEQGFDVLLGVNRGVCASLNTPDAIIAKLSQAMAAVASLLYPFYKKYRAGKKATG